MTSSLEKKLAVTSVFPTFYKNQAKSRNETVRRRPVAFYVGYFFKKFWV